MKQKKRKKIPVQNNTVLIEHLISGAFAGFGISFLFSLSETYFSYHLPQETGRLATFLSMNYFYYVLGLLGGGLLGFLGASLVPILLPGWRRNRSKVSFYIVMASVVLMAYSILSLSVAALRLPTLFVRSLTLFPDVRPVLFSLMFPPISGMVLFTVYLLVLRSAGHFVSDRARVKKYINSLTLLAAILAISAGYYSDRIAGVSLQSSVSVIAEPGGDRPNVLVIVMDTLRADHLSCYGYERNTSPFLDRLSRESTLFTQVIATSNWTGPSHGSLFTGLYPFEHGMHREHLYLSDNHVTLAELLSHIGYQTVAFTTNPWISRHTGLAAGFQEFYETWRVDAWREEINQFVNPLLLICRVRGRLADVITGKNMIERGMTGRDKKGTEKTTSQVREWIRERKRPDRPFFMFINFMETHLPYMPPAPFSAMHLSKRFQNIPPDKLNELPIQLLPYKIHDYYAGQFPLSPNQFQLLKDLYDGEITYLDAKINELTSELRNSGLLDNTVLIITSDHGENIGDHGHVSHDISLYDSLLKVPLIIRYPKRFPEGLRTDKLVQNLDIFPTLLEILGIQWTGPYSIQGISILPLEEDKRHFAFSQGYFYKEMASVLREKYPAFDYGHLVQRYYAYREGGYKYIRGSNIESEFYNVTQDQGEQINLFSTGREPLKEMESKLNLWVQLSESKNKTDDRPVEFSREMKEQLRALGYLQ